MSQAPCPKAQVTILQNVSEGPECPVQGPEMEVSKRGAESEREVIRSQDTEQQLQAANLLLRNSKHLLDAGHS